MTDNPKGLLVMMSDHEEQGDIRRWRNHVYIPHILRSGAYYQASWYEDISPRDHMGPRPGEPKFLDIFETDWDDPDEAFARVKAETKLAYPKGFRVNYREIFRATGPKQGSGLRSGPPTGLLLVLTICSDGLNEPAFNSWYDEMHLPDIIKTGAYYAAQRFENTHPQPGKSKYLALYWTNYADPNAAFDEMMRSKDGRYISPDLNVIFRRRYRLRAMYSD